MVHFQVDRLLSLPKTYKKNERYQDYHIKIAFAINTQIFLCQILYYTSISDVIKIAIYSK